MTKTVLDVGQCQPDHQSICNLIEKNYDATVIQTHGPTDTLERLRQQPIDLVLINRKLDADYTDGLEIIKLIKSDEQLAAVPVMLITNFEEHQQLAVEAGALLGFGKLEYDKPETHEKLALVLS